jgi:3-hydroxypropanoate dehydrogenase
MNEPLDAPALDQLFRTARTYPKWQERPVTDSRLQELYDLVRWGPTSMNCQPARFVFLRSAAAKERLIPALMAGDVEKVREAPVTVIIAYDTRFHARMPELWPHDPGAEAMFATNPPLAQATATRNGTLQGGYLILAARALGLDVGPMSGFDSARVDAEFFPDGRLRSNFLANLGYGDPGALYPRAPRLTYADAVTLL